MPSRSKLAAANDSRVSFIYYREKSPGSITVWIFMINRTRRAEKWIDFWQKRQGKKWWKFYCFYDLFASVKKKILNFKAKFLVRKCHYTCPCYFKRIPRTYDPKITSLRRKNKLEKLTIEKWVYFRINNANQQFQTILKHKTVIWVIFYQDKNKYQPGWYTFWRNCCCQKMTHSFPKVILSIKNRFLPLVQNFCDVQVYTKVVAIIICPKITLKLKQNWKNNVQLLTLDTRWGKKLSLHWNFLCFKLTSTEIR